MEKKLHISFHLGLGNAGTVIQRFVDCAKVGDKDNIYKEHVGLSSQYNINYN